MRNENDCSLHNFSDLNSQSIDEHVSFDAFLSYILELTAAVSMYVMHALEVLKLQTLYENIEP